MKYRELIVTPPHSSAAQTDAVLEAARRADLRQKRRLALRDGAAAIVVLLGILSAVALVRLVVPLSPAVWVWAATVALIAPAAAAFRAWRRQPDLLAGAAELDRAAALNDSLTTAVWFAETPAERSPWIDAQHERAAAAAAALDIDALCPIAPPRPLLRAAGGLAVLLAAALLVPASWSRGVFGPDAGTSIELADGTSGAADQAGGQDTNETTVTTEELLAAAEEGLRPGGGAQEFLVDGAEGGAGAGASDAGGREAAGDVPDVTGTGAPPANVERGELDEAARGEPASGESLQEALDRAADEARQAVDAAEAEAQGGEPSGEEQRGEEAGSGGGAGGAEGGAGAPTEDEAAGAMPGGHLSGPGDEAADGLTLEAARAELEVTLKREQLASPFAALAPSDEALLERQSEGGTSALPFQNVSPMRGYQGAGADAARHVPWAYQELVRNYFLERARQERRDPR